MSDFLDQLTEQQLVAVTHFRGPMLVVAGAGSGKTRVVTSRIAWLITQGVAPYQILALTFTNKAATEMKERVRQLVGEIPNSVGTFHSQCARFLRRDIERLHDGRNRDFSIYDTGDQQSIIKQVLKDLRLDGQQLKPSEINGAISTAKGNLLAPSEVPQYSWREQKIAEIYAEYEKRLRAMNAVDFDDLLLLMARLLDKFDELRAAYRERYPFLLVDEYQDTNRLQYRLLRLLCDPRENNLHATGDPDQSIYSWRGADYRNIMDFQRDFSNAKMVLLTRNYRSTANILDAANYLIAHSENRIKKDLLTANETGEKIIVGELPSDRAESEWVIAQVRNEIAAGRKLTEMAILYRINAQSRNFEEHLARAKVPYQIVGGVRFYDRREVKDILAFLKARVNPFDEISVRRMTVARPVGVGEKTLAAIFEQAAQQKMPPLAFLAADNFKQLYHGKTTAKLADFCQWCARLQKINIDNAAIATREIIELSGLTERLLNVNDPAGQERIENIEALLNRAVEFSQSSSEPTLPHFLEDVALIADIDNYQRGSEALTLMTLHSAKGLEFEVVFIAGLEEGLLPYQRFNEQANFDARTEEERRLFYVGITRARQKVYLSRANFRFINGKSNYALPSSFLRELPSTLLETSVLYDSFSPFSDNPDTADIFSDNIPY